MEKISKLKLWLIKNLPFTTVVVEGVRYYLLSKEHELVTVKVEPDPVTPYLYKKFYRFWNGVSEEGEKAMIYTYHGYTRVCHWCAIDDYNTDQFLKARISNSKELEIFKMREKMESIYDHIDGLEKKMRKTIRFTSHEIKEMEEDVFNNKKRIGFLEKEIKNLGGEIYLRLPWR